MKLTGVEQKICEKYSEKDADGLVHCDECPLNLDWLVDNANSIWCYATIDGRSKAARQLKRH